MAGDGRPSRAGCDNLSFCPASLQVSSLLPDSGPGRTITSDNWRQETAGVGSLYLDFLSQPSPSKHLLLKKLKFTKSKEIFSHWLLPPLLFR